MTGLVVLGLAIIALFLLGHGFARFAVDLLGALVGGALPLVAGTVAREGGIYLVALFGVPLGIALSEWVFGYRSGLLLEGWRGQLPVFTSGAGTLLIVFVLALGAYFESPSALSTRIDAPTVIVGAIALVLSAIAFWDLGLRWA